MKYIQSASLDSLDSQCVNVEATFTKGLPSFTIVGLISTSIQESKDRVKSALLTNDFKFPPLKITVNLSPSEIKKKGSHFDLCIALLICLYNEKNIDFSDYFIFGELGLDGTIKDTVSIFPIILSLARQNRVINVIICKESATMVSKIPNVNIFVVNNINEAMEFFKFDNKEKFRFKSDILEHSFLEVENEKYFYTQNYDEDFSDILGQDIAKFAALVSAAGNHNLLMEGSPGCGKSMIAKRLKYIMPPMSLDEILEKAKLQALDYKKIDFTPQRSYRNPHNSSTKSSIFGGGCNLQ